MAREKEGTFAKNEGYIALVVVATPVLVLLGTAVLHFTMQVLLEPNLWLRAVLIVWLPIYITIAVAGPPLLVALGVWYFIRRTESVFWVVSYVGVLIWGFWYLIPPIRENWGEFLRFVEWLQN